MIKKFSEFIEEGMWGSALRRSNTDELRKESGKKVKTSFGFDIIIENSDCDYESYLKEMIDSYDSSDNFYGVWIENLKSSSSAEHRIDIKNKSGDYTNSYIVNNFCIRFEPYKEIVDFQLDDTYENEVSEKTYLSMCEGIANVIGNSNIEYCPNSLLKKETYGNNYVLILIDEGEDMGEYIGEDFDVADFESGLDDLGLQDELLLWSYNNYGTNIGVRLNTNNLHNYKKYLDYTKDYLGK